MRVAIASWQGRVSPVFDFSGRLLLSDIEDGIEQTRQDISLGGFEPQARAEMLAKLKVNILICGAIAWPTEAALFARGIEVIPHIRGDVGSVLVALLHGQLGDDAFLMPGCRNRGVQFRYRHGRGRPSR